MPERLAPVPTIPAEYFATLAETLSDTIITIDVKSRIQYVNPAVESLLGYTPRELIGRKLTRLMPQHLRARHVAGIRRYLKTHRPRIPWQAVSMPAVHKSGREVDVEISFGTFTSPAGERFFSAVMREVSDRVRGVRWLETHRWLALQYATTRALAEATGLLDGAPLLLEAIGRAIGWDAGELWLADPQTRRLRCVESWHAMFGLPSPPGANAGETTFQPGTGLPQRVWLEGKPDWLSDITTDPGFVRASVAAHAGLHAGCAFPIRHQGQPLGVLAFFTSDVLPPDRNLMELLHHLGDQIGDFIVRVQSQELARASEQRFRALVEQSSDAIALLDADGVIRYASKSTERVLGYLPDELAGTRALDLVHPDDLEPARRLFAQSLGTPGASVRAEYRSRHKDGSWRMLEGVGVNRLDDPSVRAIVANFRDVTERKVAEAALRASEQRYALAARGANDGLWDWDLASDRVYYSPRWKAMLGYEEGEVGDQPHEWLSRVHSLDVGELRGAIQAHLAGRTPHLEHEHRVLHKDGDYRWVVCRGLAVRDAGGQPVRMAGSQTDVTDRKAAEARLRDQAVRDALTGLPNRALFRELLAQAVEHAERTPSYQFAVLFLDLDRFKVVNDSLGHLIGDQFLIAIARRLERCVRPGDTVARFGGDEFAVLLDGVNQLDDTTAVADRIRQALATPFDVRGNEIFTTVSIGISDSTAGYRNPDEVLRNADVAMYRAKSAGRAGFQVFDAGMHAAAVALHELETGLRRAVEREEFVLHYQPIVALDSGEISGYEALVRWMHPQQGLRYPAEFMSVAEETGLILPIGFWVLREACRQMQAWRTRFPKAAGLSVSVNLAAKQLLQPDFAERVSMVLEETRLAPEGLILEITERVLMEDTELAGRVLAQLRARGVRIHLDDFGAGYSSLRHLYTLPIDVLKIDRTFVGGVGVSKQNTDIIAAIRALAAALGLGLIAEGVETKEEYAALRTLDCPLGQGFYLSEPVDGPTLEHRLGEGQEVRQLTR